MRENHAKCVTLDRPVINNSITPSPFIQCWLQVCLLVPGQYFLVWIFQASDNIGSLERENSCNIHASQIFFWDVLMKIKEGYR